MGICNTSKKKLPQNFLINNYGINNFNSEIISKSNRNEMIKLEIRLTEFLVKGFPQGKHYIGKIIFQDFVFYLPLTLSGKELKFNFTESFYMDIEFDQLKTSYMELTLYQIIKLPTPSQQKKKKLTIENYLKISQPISSFKMDLLTIAIGPEHHDILLTNILNNEPIGRINFFAHCNHIEKIQININSIIFNLHQYFQNEICFKLKYIDDLQFFESNYTRPVKAQMGKNGDIIYKWVEDNYNNSNTNEDGKENIENSDTLEFILHYTSASELRDSNLELIIYEVKYEFDENINNYFSKSIRESDTNLLSTKRTNYKSENNLFLESRKESEYGFKDKEDEIRSSKIIRTGTLKKNQSTLFQNKVFNFGVKSMKDHFNHTAGNFNVNPIMHIHSATNVIPSNFNGYNTEKNHFENNHTPIKEFIGNDSFEENGKIFELDNDKKKTIEENYPDTNPIKIAKVACCPDINLKCKYSEIGVMRMNFYEILQEKEDNIRKRTSRVFRSFSHHYATNEISKDSPNKIIVGNENNNLSNFNLNGNNQLNTDSIANIPESHNNNPPINYNEYSGLAANVIKFNIFDSISSAFCQDVLNNGREIGKIDGFIIINKIPSIKQIMCGVHTERGLDISANYLGIPNANVNSSTGNNDRTNLPQELKQINLNSEMLLIKLIQKSSFNFKEISIRELNQEIVTILEDLFKLLSISAKQNCLLYNYNNEDEIAQAQQIFLDLGVNIVHVLDDMVNEQRQLGYKIVELIMERTELDLANLSLTQYPQYSKNLQEIKIKVCELFFNFMLQTLNYTLDKLGRKVNDNKLKNFIENFLAYCYFKIPKFQKKFLQISSRDVNIEQYKDELDENTEYHNEMITLMDWQHLFYNQLLKIPELTNFFKKKSEELEELLKKTEWQERISKRGLGFLAIVTRLETIIEKKLSLSKNIRWNDIPGMKINIESINYELQKCHVSQYSDSLIRLLRIFINDPQIINKFFKTIITKTNVYDPVSVFKMITILDNLFEEYEKKKDVSDFGYKFDYETLKIAYDIILKEDHSMNVAKLLWFYYKDIDSISIIHLNEIFHDIFKNRFFTLFFSWSWQVRNIFYHLLWFSIGFKLKNKSFVNDKWKLGKERLERLNKKDDVGFYKAFNNDYPDQMKSAILNMYYEKMIIVEKFKSTIKKENMDPTYNVEFKTEDEILKKYIPEELKKYVVVAMHHYNQSEKSFKAWEKEYKLKKEITILPIIQLTPPKDDVIEYSSIIDNW